MKKKSRTRQQLVTDITPLVDVVFLLLIFFLVTTVFKKEHFAFDLTLPKTQEGESASPQAEKNPKIEIHQSKIAFNEKIVSLKELQSELEKIKEKTKPIELYIDKMVPYQEMVDVLEILKKTNLANISLMTDQKK